MSKKLLLVAMGLAIAYCSMTAQTMSGSLAGTFVHGISPVVNTITATALPNTVRTVFSAFDSVSRTPHGSYTDDNSSDGFTWGADMGQFPQGTVVAAQFYDASNSLLGNSDTLRLKILAKPQWLVDGNVSNVVVNANNISFQGNYPIRNYDYTIPPSILGIGGRSLNINGTLVFEAAFNMEDSTATVNNNKGQIALNVLNQFQRTEDINFPSNCTLGKDLNLSYVISHQISTRPFSINTPKIRFPVGITKVSIDAGLSLYATLKGQLVIGQQQGRFGFVDNGTERTKVTGVLTGNGYIRGGVSVLAGLASATASLTAKARLGVGFDFVSVPSPVFRPLFGGDLEVRGKVCLKAGFGLLRKCWNSPSFYNGSFGDISVLSSRSSLSSFDPKFNTPSFTFRDTGTLVLPDFDPQPTFSTRGDMLYAVWLERNGNNGYLLLSKLNATGTAFSTQKTVAYNNNYMSNPKVGILSDGSAIITWSQSRYNPNTVPLNANAEELAQAQDVWFAIYDNTVDSITYTGRLGDDFSNPQSGRAEGEAKIAVGANSAMISWVSKDAGANSSDIWFTHLTQTSSAWNLTTPAKLADLSGSNSNLGVVYTNNSKALVVWINDPDGDEDTYDSKIMFARWDGNTWDNAQALLNNDGASKLKEVSLASNAGFVSLAWTSTHFESNNDFQNRIDMELYNVATDNWDASSHFQDADSLYYFQNPIAAISNTGIASICYKVTNMFPDTAHIDNGQLYLYVRNLNTSSNWTEITNNAFLSDTNTFIWSLAAGFSGNNRYYTLTQEYNDNGVVTNPSNGVKFGDPNLSMVLRGIQINPNLTVSDIAEPRGVPTGLVEAAYRPNFRMLNNFPNPFNDLTTIEFELQQSSNVVLEVFDFTGTKVSQLLNTKLSAGIYKTVFKAGDLPSGIYFSKLTVDGVTTTGKLMLTK